ncbi:cytochrome P450 CYP736A12-like [Syzygium oleosum]|uniref:cytochrome P450 CYP736A12-like n=1 Tax=Syzygium oleosum TaxID=219896 RepID=UPI0024B9B45A|nr:cytochrome P450 CYP736A12-like [Syzygium oleosum]
METSPLALLSTILLIALYFFFHHLRRRNAPKLPPGPPPLPVIGNLHQLGNLPHRSLHSLAKSYGPIMFLRLGNKPTVVVSSPEAAKLVLKTHDSIFSSRPSVNALHHMSYGNKGMAFAESGAYWRGLRRLCMLQLLSPAKVESFAPMRREELGRMVVRVRAAAAAREAVDVSAEVGQLIGDLACRMILGCSTRDKFNLKPVIHEALNLAGAFNLADYVPLLGALDLQGMTRRAKAVNRAMDKVFEDIIREHEEDTTGKYKGDFIDTLLAGMGHPINSSQDEQVHIMGRTNVKAIALDMIAASYESSSTAIEWALSELIRNPRMMKHLKKELEAVVGLGRTVEESDLPKLNYLDMVVKESFRLYPPGPLLIPHESTEDIEISGYYIAKRTRVIVNAWALGRDTNAWAENAEEFFPERFASSGVDVKGRDFQLIPFGSGRRGCPGMNLGLVNTRLVLAQLVHCFDWELPEGTSPNELDMSEDFGLSMPRAKHLILRPSYRLLV